MKHNAPKLQNPPSEDQITEEFLAFLRKIMSEAERAAP